MTQWMKTAYLIVAWTFLILLIGQVFLAGLGIFDTVTFWDWHRIFGYDVIWPGALVLLIVAALSRPPRRTLILALGTMALTSVLPFLPSAGGVLAAFHPVIAFILVGLVISLAIQARNLAPPPLGRAEPE